MYPLSNDPRPVWVCFFGWTQNIFWIMYTQTADGSQWLSFSILQKSMATTSCYQHFCVQQKKLTHTGLEQEDLLPDSKILMWGQIKKVRKWPNLHKSAMQSSKSDSDSSGLFAL